jgi:hypothetical protein
MQRDGVAELAEAERKAANKATRVIELLNQADGVTLLQ